MDPPLHKSQDIWRRVESSVPWSQHHLAGDSEHSVSPCKAISKRTQKKNKVIQMISNKQKLQAQATRQRHTLRSPTAGATWPFPCFHGTGCRMAIVSSNLWLAQKCAATSLYDVRAPSKVIVWLSLCIPDFALMKTRFKPLTLWKFQSRPEVRHTLLVLRQQQYACNDQIHSNAFI